MKQITPFLRTLFFYSFFISTTFAKSNLSPITINYEVINSSCIAASDGVIVINNISGGIAPYQMYLNGDFIGEDLVSINGLSFGEYTLAVYDSEGEVGESIIKVDFNEDLDFTLTDEVTIRRGDYYTIDLQLDTEIDGITWFLAPAIDNRFILNPTVNPEKDQIYKAEIRYKESCVLYTEVFVKVDNQRYVYFPNIFSPNNDGVNDLFYPSISSEVTHIKRFIISDRWGRIVHSRRGQFVDPIEVSWDGRSAHKLYETGQYIYLCEVEFRDGQVIKYKGSVSIL